MIRAAGLVAIVTTGVVSLVTVSGCSDSGPTDPPTLDRIDGPAQVDPSYDPFVTDPAAPVTAPVSAVDG